MELSVVGFQPLELQLVGVSGFTQFSGVGALADLHTVGSDVAVTLIAKVHLALVLQGAGLGFYTGSQLVLMGAAKTADFFNAQPVSLFFFAGEDLTQFDQQTHKAEVVVWDFHILGVCVFRPGFRCGCDDCHVWFLDVGPPSSPARSTSKRRREPVFIS